MMERWELLRAPMNPAVSLMVSHSSVDPHRSKQKLIRGPNVLFGEDLFHGFRHSVISAVFAGDREGQVHLANLGQRFSRS